MPNNAEHIKVLEQFKGYADRDEDWEYVIALRAAIRALRNEGKSPWRKVTKRHPGKKWEGQQVLVAYENGTMDCGPFPTEPVFSHGWESIFNGRVTHWQPWPEHPEKGLSHGQ